MAPPRKPGEVRKSKGCLPETHRALQRRYKAKLRAEVIAAYGGRCICCKNAYLPHLTVDHVNGDGAIERRSLDVARLFVRLRREAKEGRLDERYQVLCFNCNIAKHTHGRCGCSDGDDHE